MDLERITREWAKSRSTRGTLVRLPGTALHLKPEVVAAILLESKKSGRPVGEIVREDYIELAFWLRERAGRERDVAGVLERFFDAGLAGSDGP